MFQFKSLLVLLGAASCAFSAPSQDLAPRADSITDTQILQFAMTLELLESSFYNEGLDKLDEQAFANAGFPAWVRARFEQIKEHENQHVAFLKGVLGDASPQACTYNFPYDDPRSFAALSMALESVGGSAYLGAAHLVQNKDVLTSAGSILAVENQHAAWVSSAVLKGSAWSGTFATPLSADGVYSLASQFIASCPETNPQLPVTPLPKLTINPASPRPNDLVQFNFNSDEVKADGQQLFVAFFDGLQVQYADLDGNKQATVPGDLQGTVYAAIAKSKDNNPTAQEILTGLVMFEIGFPSYVGNP